MGTKDGSGASRLQTWGKGGGGGGVLNMQLDNPRLSQENRSKDKERISGPGNPGKEAGSGGGNGLPQPSPNLRTEQE